MTYNSFQPLGRFLVCFASIALIFVGPFSGFASELSSYQWDLVNPAASWSPRAGLQVVDLNDRFYMMGGRTPVDPAVVPVFGASEIWGDVWTSEDKGATWERILETDAGNHWPARAYFQAVTKGN